MTDVPAAVVETPIQKASRALYEQIAATAVVRATLEQVRWNRDAPSEQISDAAQAFRAAEGLMMGALGNLLDLQVQALLVKPVD